MISFTYFDLGGVVMSDLTANNKWVQMKRDMGVTSKDDPEFEIFFTEYENEVCIGRDVETLIPLMKKKFYLDFPNNYSLLEDFVRRFEANRSIWPVIDEVQKHCKAGLLTNMYPRMFDEIKKSGILPEVSWDIIIDSSIVGLMKPDPKIFELAEEKAGVVGKEILFVENSLRHVNAAQEFGWQTFLYDPKNPERSSLELSHFFEKIR